MSESEYSSEPARGPGPLPTLVAEISEGLGSLEARLTDLRKFLAPICSDSIPRSSVEANPLEQERSPLSRSLQDSVLKIGSLRSLVNELMSDIQL